MSSVKPGCAVANLPKPELQANLEKDFPDSPMITRFAKFEPGPVSAQEALYRRQLYMVFLIAMECYENYMIGEPMPSRSQLNKIAKEEALLNFGKDYYPGGDSDGANNGKNDGAKSSKKTQK